MFSFIELIIIGVVFVVIIFIIIILEKLKRKMEEQNGREENREMDPGSEKSLPDTGSSEERKMD